MKVFLTAIIVLSFCIFSANITEAAPYENGDRRIWLSDWSGWEGPYEYSLIFEFQNDGDTIIVSKGPATPPADWPEWTKTDYKGGLNAKEGAYEWVADEWGFGSYVAGGGDDFHDDTIYEFSGEQWTGWDDFGSEWGSWQVAVEGWEAGGTNIQANPDGYYGWLGWTGGLEAPPAEDGGGGEAVPELPPHAMQMIGVMLAGAAGYIKRKRMMKA